MRPTDMEKLFREMHTPAPARLDERVYRTIDQAAGSVPAWRRIMRHPITKLAVAVALLIGLFCLTRHMIGKEGAPTQAPVESAQDRPAEIPERRVIVDEVDSTEIDEAKRLFEQGEVGGLLTLLEDGSAEVKLAVARYLEQIGDQRANPALQRLAEAWQGPSEENPFQRALDVIESRLRLNTPDPNRQGRLAPSPAPAWTFQARGVLSGVITDAVTGAPIPGVQIEIWSHPETVSTDEYGFYSFDEIRRDGNWRMRTRSKAYLVGGWHTIVLKQSEAALKHFQLEPGCRVAVAVVDEGGRPIEGAEVAASWLGGDFKRMDLAEDETDASGRVLIGALEASETEYRLIARHRDFSPAQVTLKLLDPGVIEHAHIELEGGIEVNGFAEYADGVAATGVEVSARPDWWHSRRHPKACTVDGEGLFTLRHVVSGVNGLRAHFRDEKTGMGQVVPAGQARLPLPEGELLTIRLARKSPSSLASISGRIIWETERKPDYLEITAESRTTGLDQRLVLLEGVDSFAIHSLEPGDYNLRFKGEHFQEETVENVRAPMADLVVVLRAAEDRALKGVAVSVRSQEAIRRFEARVVKLETLRGPNYTPDAKWRAFEDGGFDLKIVGPGVYQVEIRAPGYAPALSTPINTDENSPVRVALTRGGGISGTVVDSNGVRLNNATVVALSHSRGNMPRTFDRFMSDRGFVRTVDGMFTLTHLPRGGETLKVAHPDYAFVIAEDIEIVEGETTDEVEIVLSRGGGMAGVLYDREGKPEGGVTLYLQDREGYGGSDREAGRLAVVVTDTSGRYEVTGLPPGKLCFVERSNQEVFGLVKWVFLPVEGVTTSIDRSGSARISGSILINEEPAANRELILTYPGESSGAFRYVSMTDGFGEFVIHGIPPGIYALRLRRTGQRNSLIHLKTFVCGVDDVELGRIAMEWTSLEVTLSGEGEKLGPWRVSLHEGLTLPSRAIGDVTEPQEEGDPYLIANVPVGTRRLVAKGAVTVRKTIEVVASDEPLKVNLTVPAGSASVGGAFQSSVSQPFALWNADQTVTAHIRGGLSRYHIDHLPAGRYRIGHTIIGDLVPLVEFTLLEGEQKVLDLDTDTWPTDMGFLTLNVANEEGQILSQAVIWLDSDSGRIDPTWDWGWHLSFCPPVGEYVLMVQCEGYQTYTAAITIEPYRWYSKDAQQQRRVVRLRAR